MPVAGEFAGAEQGLYDTYYIVRTTYAFTLTPCRLPAAC
jgi:hypothetical protein